MKKTLLFVLPLAALMFVSCKKKEAAPPMEEPVETSVVEETTTEATPAAIPVPAEAPTTPAKPAKGK